MVDQASGQLESGFFNRHRNEPKTKNAFGTFELSDELLSIQLLALNGFHCVLEGQSEITLRLIQPHHGYAVGLSSIDEVVIPSTTNQAHLVSAGLQAVVDDVATAALTKADQDIDNVTATPPTP